MTPDERHRAENRILLLGFAMFLLTAVVFVACEPDDPTPAELCDKRPGAVQVQIDDAWYICP